MAHDEKLLQRLTEKARVIRRDAVEMIKAGDSGWIGGSFSQADIIAALMFHQMKHDPKNPRAHYFLGRLYRENKECQRAITTSSCLNLPRNTGSAPSSRRATATGK